MKVLWLKLTSTNHDPKVIARIYLNTVKKFVVGNIEYAHCSDILTGVPSFYFLIMVQIIV